MASAKRLMKSRDNRVLFGVAGGAAEYFDVDPVLVRAGFVVLTFFGGMGLVLYVVMAIIMPTAPERTQAPVELASPGTLGPAPAAIGVAPPTPGEPSRREGWRSARAVFGLVLVALGLLFLLDNLGLLRFRWGVFWPLVLIALGVAILAARWRRS